jgi:ADP-heptose:LPS heptosyltransferase
MTRQADLSAIAPEKILVCQQRQIGDVILALPALELLKERFPAAQLHVFTEKKCAPVLEHHPAVDRIWTVDKKAGPLAQLRQFWTLRQEKFDVSITLQHLPRCLQAVFMAWAPVRISFPLPGHLSWLSTHTSQPPDASVTYAAAHKASVLAPLGIEYDARPPRMAVTDQETAQAKGFLTEAGLAPSDILISVDPSHRRPTRKWPAEHFGRLVDLALAQEPRLRFLLLYGPGEHGDAQAVADASTNPERIIIPERMLSLREMAAVLTQAQLHVGNCSAPRHMAAAVGAPTLTILGSTGQEWTCPNDTHEHAALGLDCQPCKRNACDQGDIPCLTGLTPEAVLPALLRLLGQ